MGNSLLLVYRVGFEAQGIIQKMYAQRDALCSLGFDVKLKFLKGDNNTNRWYRFSDVVLFFSQLSREIDAKNFDFVYIRFTPIDFGFERFIKKLKKTNPDIKIILEIPTYPFTFEYKAWSRRWYFELFKTDLGSICECLHTVLYIGEKFKCKHVPCIKINNAAEVLEYPLRKYSYEEDSYHFAVSGSLFFWMGLDRLFNGIVEYYKNNPRNKKITVHIIGAGPMKHRWQREFKNKVNIIFYNFNDTFGVNQVWNKADLGIGSLGAHRKNVYHLSPLKHREYAARGIPFVYAGIDEHFENKNYLLRVPSNDEEIDISSVLDHIDKLRQIGNNVVGSYLQNVAKSLTWENELSFLKNLLNSEI